MSAGAPFFAQPRVGDELPAMTLGSDELSRMADQVDVDRTIMQSVFCSRCGYNLRYGKYVGRCTECGHPYNARPLVMKGIFSPQDLRFPLSDIVLALSCPVLGAWIIRGAVNPVNDWLLILGSALVLVGLFYVRSACRDLSRFVRFARIRRRIEAEEEE